MTRKESTITRDIILDLIPAYLAGEATEDTRSAVDYFADIDPEIAKLIRAGDRSLAVLKPSITAPKKLENIAIKRLQHKIRKQTLYVAMATISILMVPFIAMMFTNEVNWSPADFIVMGGLLMFAGTGYVVIANLSDNLTYKLGTALAALSGLLLIWVNLAVGFIGSSGHAANMLYLMVYVTAIGGLLKYKLTAKGMAKTMFVTAWVQILVPVIAWTIWPESLSQSPGPLKLMLLNGFFAGLFVSAGLLYRRAESHQASPTEVMTKNTL
jgi:hypothetical protein